MKKRSFILSVIMTMVMFCLVACGGGKDFAGTYALESMKSGDQTITIGQYAEMMGVSEDEAKNSMKLELKSDGTCVINIFGEDNGSNTGSWKADGNKITITGKNADGSEDSAEATIDGDTLTLKMGDEEMVMKKQ